MSARTVDALVTGILVAIVLGLMANLLLFNCADLDRATKWGFRFIWLCMAVAGACVVIGAATSST